MVRITTKDIAKACGISRGTVDRALNNKPRVSESTKALVLRTARELNYVPDHAARSLVTGRSMTLGVVVFDIRNRYFAQLVNAIEIRAKASDYILNITLQENDPKMERRQIENLAGRRVDGLILCPVNKGAEFHQFLKRLSIPVVVIGNYVGRDLPFIGIDEERATAEAVNLIASRGYERIVFICPSLEDAERENIYTHQKRLSGFKKSIAGHPAIGSTLIDHRNFNDEIPALLSRSHAKTALLCSGDTYALETMKYLRTRGIRIPKDLGMMGFDGIDTLAYLTPSLATVRVPLEEMGTLATDYLLSAIDGKPAPRRHILPHEIVEGESL